MKSIPTFVSKTLLGSCFGLFFVIPSWGQGEVFLSPGSLPGNAAVNARQSELVSVLVGFSYGLSVTSTYIDNVDLQEDGGENSFMLSTGANLSYRTAGDGEATLVGAFSYSPSYQFYLSGRDLPGAFRQAASASLQYKGGAFSGSLQGGYSSGGGQNALAGGYFDSSSLDITGSFNWNFSPKTFIGATAAYRSYGFEGSGLGGSDSTSFGFIGSWQATPLIRIGPYIDFTHTDSDTAGSLDATGYGLNFNYELTGKTSLSGTFGFQNRSFDEGGSSNSFVGSLNLVWNPNDLYRVNLGFNTSTLATPTVTNQFTDNYVLNLGVSRELGVGRISLASSLNFSKTEGTDAAISEQEDRQFVNFVLNYNRPVFREEASFNTSIGYRKGYGGRKFSGFTLSCGLSYAF